MLLHYTKYQATQAGVNNFNKSNLDKISKQQLETLQKLAIQGDQGAKDILAKLGPQMAGISKSQMTLIKDLASSGNQQAKDILAKLDPQLADKKTSAIQNSTLLNVHKTLLQAQEKIDRKLDSFKAEHGAPVVIGQTHDMFGDMIDVLGYKDPKLQTEYERMSSRSEQAEIRLKTIEENDRYKIARATELAKQMDINTKNGKEIKFTATGNVPTSINGKAVDENLLTAREKQNINNMDAVVKEINTNMMDITPSVSPISPDTTPPTLQERPESKTNALESFPQFGSTCMTAAQAERLIALQIEQNRLLKKQTTTIENNS